MTRNSAVLLGAFVCAAAAAVSADEGMWLFNHPPADAINSKYHVQLTPSWLEHVQKSSVRFNSGGSGSFVSGDGLTFTNHHVAQTCLHAISTASKDLYKTGFYAATPSQEARCPDLELNVLTQSEDVTAKVNEGTSGLSVSAAGARQRANMSNLEAQCSGTGGQRCQVVSFYSGSLYERYHYKKYTDVRLVFAPEFDIAFFGGDPDNFEYPRYDLDVAFFRVYENGRPVKIDNYLKWSTAGAAADELVFVSGHPGSTDRLATLSQLGFLRDLALPFQLESGTRRRNVLAEWGRKAPENYRRAQESIFGIENNLKRNKVYLSSLSDAPLMAKKQSEEMALKTAFTADQQRTKEIGDPWSDLEHAMGVEREIFLPLMLVERRAGFGGELAGYARALVRSAEERKKPNGDRLREYGDSNLPSLEQSLFAASPVYTDMEEVVLADSLALLAEKLPNDPVTKEVLNGRNPTEVAHQLVSGSKLADPAVRRRLYEGGTSAIQHSMDPMIDLMRRIDSEARKYRTRYEDEVASVERIAGSRIGKLRFEQNGFRVAPDATFTLRLSYGAVRGYTEDGVGDAAPKGTTLAPFTTIGGAFEHAEKKGQKDPFKLPQSWLDARKAGRLKLDTPLNFVSTPDIIGGNSGSPVINKDGDVVGIIFDGNMQSLPWRYVYDDAIGRAVSVDSRGIIEALRHVYNASRVVQELTGQGGTGSSSGAR